MRVISDMVVVITGASSGIGAALARELHVRGARLALAARRRDLLDALNAELGGGHLVVPTDVAEAVQCGRLIELTVEHFGRIDTLVANAGYGLARRLADTSADEFRRIFEVNVFGSHNCITAAVAAMRRNQPGRGAASRRYGMPWREDDARAEASPGREAGMSEARAAGAGAEPVSPGAAGQVMIVSSGAARRGLPFFGAYSATKAAQLNLAEALRIELEPEGIAVTTVLPTTTQTPFFDVAEAAGGLTVQTATRIRRQTAAHVARRMADAIARPRREVWPARHYRYLLALSVLSPWLSDTIMRRVRREIEEANAEADSQRSTVESEEHIADSGQPTGDSNEPRR